MPYRGKLGGRERNYGINNTQKTVNTLPFLISSLPFLFLFETANTQPAKSHFDFCIFPVSLFLFLFFFSHLETLCTCSAKLSYYPALWPPPFVYFVYFFYPLSNVASSPPAVRSRNLQRDSSYVTYRQRGSPSLTSFFCFALFLFCQVARLVSVSARLAKSPKPLGQVWDEPFCFSLATYSPPAPFLFSFFFFF